MLKGYMTAEEIGQCVEAARLLRESGLGRSDRVSEGWDPEKVRWLVEREDSWDRAEDRFEAEVSRLRDYLRLLAEVRQEHPLAYPHLVEAMYNGGYLPGEILPIVQTAPFCVILYAPERTLALVRAAMDGTLLRLMKTMDETKGKGEPEDEAGRKLLEAYPSLCPGGEYSHPFGFLSLYLDWVWERDIYNRFASLRGRLLADGVGTVDHHYLSWKGFVEAKVSGFADLPYSPVWERQGGIPQGPFLHRFRHDRYPGLAGVLREVGGDDLAVFTFRVPIMDNGFAFYPQAVLIHSAEEHPGWQEREPMFASAEVSHGLGAVLTGWGRMEKKAYLQGGYVKPAENGVRLVFGDKFC